MSLEAHPLLFEDLIRVLRSRGFDVGVTEQIRLHELFELLPHDFAPSGVANLICPVVAKTPEQQARFHAMFDELFPALARASTRAAAEARTGAWPEAEVTARLPRRRTGYLLAFGTTLLALVGLWLVLPRLATDPLDVEEAPPETRTDVPSGAPVGVPQDQVPPPAPPLTPPTDEVEREPPAGGTAPLIPLPQGRQWLFLTIPFLGWAVLQWWSRRRRQAVVEAHRSKRPPLTLKSFGADGDVSPFDEGEIREAAHELRRREPGDLLRLDVAASIAATIANRGYPTLRYRTPLRAPDYVVLVQRSSREDHQAALFDSLLGDLSEEELPFVRYFFHDDPQICYADPARPHEALDDLRGRFGSSRLLVFSSGEEFLDPVTGELAAWVEDAVDWNRRAILTPIRPEQWGARELMLAGHFVVVPASTEGTRAVVDLFAPDAQGMLASPAASETTAPLPPRDTLDAESVDRLASYLGEGCFRWLCACAVYPELQWDLTLRLGQLQAVGADLVTEQNLLRLIALPWFRAGRIPDEARLLLLARLDEEDERTIRLEIVRLLGRNLGPEESIAGEEQRLQIAMQSALAFWKDRKKRRRALKKLAAFPAELLARDFVTSRLLTRRSRLAIALPEAVRHLLYRGGTPIYGWRSSLQLFVTVVVALLILAAMPRVVLPPEALSTLADEAPPPPPAAPECENYTAAYNVDGSCFDEPPRPLEAPLVPVPSELARDLTPSTFAVRVNSAGQLLELQSTGSSGSPAFDSIAELFAAGIGYAPALKDGAPVAAWTEVPFQPVGDPQSAVVATGPGLEVSGSSVPSGLGAVPADTPAPLLLLRQRVELVPGEQAALSTYIEDGAVTSRVRWSSLDPTIATVTEDGRSVVGVAVGRARLVASATDSQSAELTVEVVGGAMRLAREALTLPIGESALVEALVGIDGRRVDPAQLQFRVMPPSLADVAVDGTVTGRSEGSGEVSVSGGLGTRSIPLTVYRPIAAMATDPPPGLLRVPRGGAIPVAVLLADLNRTSVPEARVRWVVEDSSVVSLQQADRSGQGVNLVAGETLGVTRLEARAEYGPAFSWDVEVLDADLRFEPAWVALDLNQIYAPVTGFVIDGELQGAPLAPRRSVSDSTIANWVEDAALGTVLIGQRWGSTTAWIEDALGHRDSLPVHVVPQGVYVASGFLRRSSERTTPLGWAPARGGLPETDLPWGRTLDLSVEGGRLIVESTSVNAVIGQRCGDIALPLERFPVQLTCSADVRISLSQSALTVIGQESTAASEERRTSRCVQYNRNGGGCVEYENAIETVTTTTRFSGNIDAIRAQPIAPSVGPASWR